MATSNIPDAANSHSGIRREDWMGTKYLKTCLSPLDNGPDHEARVNRAQSTIAITRNGESLGSAAYHCVWLDAPFDQPADYEVSLDSRRQERWRRYSTRVRSTWKFHSSGGEHEVMPVILADLAVPSASATGQVKVGKRATITLGLRHQKGSVGSTLTSAKLEMSYDGNTWTGLPLAPAGAGKYIAPVTHPVDQAGNTVHLRLAARDENGGQLTQEITSAYGLTS